VGNAAPLKSNTVARQVSSTLYYWWLDFHGEQDRGLEQDRRQFRPPALFAVRSQKSLHLLMPAVEPETILLLTD